jgi:hypothetical protein
MITPTVNTGQIRLEPLEQRQKWHILKPVWTLTFLTPLEYQAKRDVRELWGEISRIFTKSSMHSLLLPILRGMYSYPVRARDLELNVCNHWNIWKLLEESLFLSFEHLKGREPRFCRAGLGSRSGLIPRLHPVRRNTSLCVQDQRFKAST